MRLQEIIKIGVATLMLVVTGSVPAADVEVLALLGSKAMIRVDGHKHMLAIGQSTPDGIKLVSANTEGATLRTDGKEKFYRLGVRVRARNSVPQKEEFQIWRDPAGMFRTVGSINGLPVNFLVDTGASAVAMNAKEAKRLGIDFRVVGEPGAVMTASRMERVYQVKLKSVKVGNIELRNVDAVVLEGAQPTRLLLGMSFLGRLEMQNSGNLMTLRTRK